MKQFLHAKIISLLFPLLLIVFGMFVWTGDATSYWWFLFVVTMILGYIHSFVGLFYQVRSFHRSQQSRKLFGLFSVLFLISTAICFWFIMQDLAGAFVMFVLAYFIIHGFLNEKTILLMQTGIQLPTIYFVTLSLLSTAVIYGSLLHPSFFFDSTLQFSNLSEFSRLWVIEKSLGADPQYIAYGLYLTALGLFVVSLRVMRRRLWLHLSTAIVFLLVAGIFLVWYPLNYIHLFHLFLSYHFIVWSVVLYQKFCKEQPERLRSYIYHHAYVAVPILVLLGLLVGSGSDSVEHVTAFVFSANTFLTVSFVHITLSFMNEAWFKSLFKIT